MTAKLRIREMARKARQASLIMAHVPASVKKNVLLAMADAVEKNTAFILKENVKDLKAAVQEKYSTALIDRLTLNDKRISAIAKGLRETAQLKDNIGEVLETIKRPNGLVIKKIRVPLGVVGIVFESRPNVTSDCAGLCFKSGNAAILKGGREAHYSNQAIYKVLKAVLVKHQMPPEAIQLIASTDRKAVHELLSCDDYVDVIVPRGGESLIRFVVENTRIPVIKHYKGVCHVYVSRCADFKKATAIVLNAKTQKPGVCNAIETLLIDKAIANKFLPNMIEQLFKAGCQLRGALDVKRFDKRVKNVTVKNWSTEYLDLILNVRIVDGIHQAIEHINTFGSHHSDSIISQDKKEQEVFLSAVDSACVYANASTRFTDGFEFGFGAEVGISTDKLHVRGPMGLDGLTSYKYIIQGNGQVRL